MKITKAVIPVAGLGTRFLPATKTQPKEMLPILNVPLIQLVVEEAVESGITDILIITGKGKRAIEDHFDMSVNVSEKLEDLRKVLTKVNIFYTRQSEPKGLGDAILCAKSFVGDEPFVVMLGDDFYINCKTPATKQLMNQYGQLEPNSALIGIETMSKENMTSKGMVSVEGASSPFTVTDLVEKPSLDKVTSNLSICGRYILPPQIFDAIKSTKPGYGGEIQLTDAIKSLLSSGTKIYAQKITGFRIDVGTPRTYLEANLRYAMSQDNTRDHTLKFMKELLRQQQL